jgi:hypothetical protein
MSVGAVGVGVRVAVGVTGSSVAVIVDVLVGLAVTVSPGVMVGIGVSVGGTVLVDVAVAVLPDVMVGVREGVSVGGGALAVAVGDLAGVLLLVGVAVVVFVGGGPLPGWPGLGGDWSIQSPAASVSRPEGTRARECPANVPGRGRENTETADP